MKKSFLLLVACLTLMTSVHAAITTPSDGNTTQDKSADLLDIFRQALESDPTFKQAEASLLSQHQNIPITRALLLPQLFASANTAYNHNTTRIKPLIPAGSSTTKNRFNYNSQNYGVNLTQTLFDVNQWITYQQSKTQVKAADASYGSALQNLMVRTANAYFNVLLAEDNLRYTEAEKRAVYQNLEQVQAQYAVGLVSITGVYQAQASYDAILASEITARNNIVNARENLRAMTGIYYNTLAGLKSGVPFVSLKPKLAEEWVNLSNQYNWDLQAARFNAEAAKQNIAIQRSEHLPTINAFADATYLETGQSPSGTQNNHASSVGVELNLPVFQGFLVSSMTKQAGYDYQNAVSQMEQSYRSAINNTRQSYNNVTAGISKIKADRQTILSDTSAVDSTQQGYKVGTQTMLDLLQQQQQLYQDQRQYASDQYDYINNLIALKQAAGTLQESDLAEINGWLSKGKVAEDTVKTTHQTIEKKEKNKHLS